MRNLIVFLSGVIVGAGVGIFAYEMYRRRIVKNEEPEITDSSESIDSNRESEPEETPTRSSIQTPITPTNEELHGVPNDYRACYERLNQLKAHDARREEEKPVTNLSNCHFTLIREDDYHSGDYPCYSYEMDLDEYHTLRDSSGEIIDDPRIVAGDLWENVVNILENEADSCVYVRNDTTEDDAEIIAVIK